MPQIRYRKACYIFVVDAGYLTSRAGRTFWIASLYIIFDNSDVLCDLAPFVQF